MTERDVRRADYPMTIPDRLLHSDAMRVACAARNFQEVFRLIHSRMPASYADMAAAVGKMTSARVGDIVRGDRGIRGTELIARVADGFGIPGSMLGIPPRSWEEGTLEGEQGDNVQRREFLAAGAGIFAGQVADMLSSERREMAAVLAESRRGDARIDYFERTADSLGVEVIKVPPRDLLETTLITFRNARQHIRGSVRGSDSARLLRANAKLANVIGEILFNEGDFENSRTWYVLARDAANESGDLSLADLALCGQTYLPTYSGDPQGVLSLTAARLESAPLAGPGIAWLWAFCGKAHAQLGNAAETERAFENSMQALDTSSGEDLKPGIFSFLPEKLNMYRASAYVSLGRADEAMSAADSAIALYDPSETTEPFLARFERASALIRAGETEEALRWATEALSAPGLYPSVSVRRRARQFDSSIKAGSTAAAHDWRDALWTLDPR